MKLPRNLMIGCLIAFASLSASAAVLQVSGGKLIGATGVNVAGTLYDVEFVDGTCISLFAPCTSPTDFTFQSGSSATQAAQALLDQVFAEGSYYDTNPSEISGCGWEYACSAWVPYAFGIGAQAAARLAQVSKQSTNAVTDGFIATDYDTGINDTSMYARWTLASVPEPIPLVLIALGLAGMALGRKCGGGWRHSKV